MNHIEEMQRKFQEDTLKPMLGKIQKFLNSEILREMLPFYKDNLRKTHKKFRERNWNKAFKMCPCRVPLITFKKMPIVPDWVSLLGVTAT